MNLRSLSLIVLCHGIVAAVFAFVFLLEAFEIALLDGATWNAWISVAVMYGFTLWGLSLIHI